MPSPEMFHERFEHSLIIKLSSGTYEDASICKEEMEASIPSVSIHKLETDPTYIQRLQMEYEWKPASICILDMR